MNHSTLPPRWFAAASTASYFVISMGLAYPWHMVWFHETYRAMGAFTRSDPIIPLGMLTILIQGGLLSAGFAGSTSARSEANRKSPCRAGLRYSLGFGAVVWSVMVPATAAKFQIEPLSRFLALGTAFQALQFTAAGVAMGWMWGRMTRPHATPPNAIDVKGP